MIIFRIRGKANTELYCTQHLSKHQTIRISKMLESDFNVNTNWKPDVAAKIERTTHASQVKYCLQFFIKHVLDRILISRKSNFKGNN